MIVCINEQHETNALIHYSFIRVVRSLVLRSSLNIYLS